MDSDDHVALAKEVATLRFHLEATAGAQLAMNVALSFLLKPHRGNPSVQDAFRTEFLRVQSSLLASNMSDYKIGAFEETMNALIESLNQ